jgi:amino acid transporter
LSTASAINATLFGTARLGLAMAQEHELPKVFSFRERRVDIPWVSLVAITGATLVFVNTADLGVISSFASSTFLLIFATINFAAFRLRKKIGSGAAMPFLGCVLATGALGVLFWHISQEAPHSLWIIGGFYAVTIASELLFSERRLLRKTPPQT